MTSPHLSTLTLHRIRYGELAGSALAEAQAHLDVCGQCASRLEAQHKERAAFVVQPIPAAIREAARRPRRSWTRWWPALPVLAMAALALLLIRPTVPEADTVRVKGRTNPMEVWVDDGAGLRMYEPTEALGAGDQVQLKYRPEGAAFAAVAGRDNTGVVEVYRAFSTPAQEGLVNIPFALTLDGAPGTQELYVILADAPLHSAIVEEAVTRHPEPTPGVRVLRTDLPKETATP